MLTGLKSGAFSTEHPYTVKRGNFSILTFKGKKVRSNTIHHSRPRSFNPTISHDAKAPG